MLNIVQKNLNNNLLDRVTKNINSDLLDIFIDKIPDSLIDEDGKVIDFEKQAALVTHHLHLLNYGFGIEHSFFDKSEDVLLLWSKLLNMDLYTLKKKLYADLNNKPFRSIREPKFTFIDLFAGIGGIRLGFESAGGMCVFSSEFDKSACKTYEANFGEYPFGDITKIDAADIPDFDILLGGFPCQAFSIIGKKEGFENETCGTLFFDIERILKAKKPKAFMLENVRNLTAHDGGKTFKIIRTHLEALGYKVYSKVLNALDFGVPQKRERIIIVGFLDDVNFEFPHSLPIQQRRKLVDVLEVNVDERYYVKDEIKKSRLMRLKDPNYPKPYISHENMAGSITPHPYSSCLRAGASANYILINDERRPTEREMLRIQGFPDNFKIVVPYTQVKHQTGNSVAVPVISAVAVQMIKALEQYK